MRFPPRRTASASAPARSACARKTICRRWQNSLRPRIGFAHLRATKREADGLSFFESDHLDGDVDMIAVVKALLTENRKRSASDQIIFRPDHGHRMLDDLAETKRTNPGYTAIGRLRGLAELRGAIRAIEHAG